MQPPINTDEEPRVNEPQKLKMTPRIGQTTCTPKKVSPKRQTDAAKKVQYVTPSGEWLGLRAEEGRGKPRKCRG